MITIKFDIRAVAEDLKTMPEKIHAQVIELLRYAKSDAVGKQREAHTYKDQSGNLTSSIGGIITDRGEIVDIGGFEPTSGNNPSTHSLSAQEAVEVGENEATKIAETHGMNPTLSIVAGMNYASFVEAKGLNVLSTGRMEVERIVSEGLKKISGDDKKVLNSE